MSRLSKKTLDLFVLATMLCFTFFCAPAYSASKGNTVSTNIKADSMEYNASAQTVVFSNNVHVARPDFELWSKKLTVYLKKDKKTGESGSSAEGMQAGDIDYLVAQGNVRFKSDDKSGECQKATYYVTQGRIVMEGSPVLRDPESVVSGHTITHYTNENRSVVSGSVNASFETPDQSKPQTEDE